jgi:hypothetical protein
VPVSRIPAFVAADRRAAAARDPRRAPGQFRPPGRRQPALQRAGPRRRRWRPSCASSPIRSQYEDFMRHVDTHGVAKADRTGTGTERVRPPDALRPERGLSAGHHQEGAPQSHHRRAAVVPARRQQRALAAGARLHHLGRMGRARRRPGPGLRRAVAQLAHARRRPHRPDRRRSSAAEDQPRLAPHHRQRLERGRAGPDGADALPRLLPVLRGHAGGGGQAQLPALPAQRRHLPGRALQHRQLRAADPHGGAAVRPGRGRLHLDRRRLPHLQQPPEQVETAAGARALPYPTLHIKRRPASIFDYEYEDFEVLATTSHPAIKAPVAV